MWAWQKWCGPSQLQGAPSDACPSFGRSGLTSEGICSKPPTAINAGGEVKQESKLWLLTTILNLPIFSLHLIPLWRLLQVITRHITCEASAASAWQVSIKEADQCSYCALQCLPSSKELQGQGSGASLPLTRSCSENSSVCFSIYSSPLAAVTSFLPATKASILLSSIWF